MLDQDAHLFVHGVEERKLTEKITMMKSMMFQEILR